MKEATVEPRFTWKNGVCVCLNILVCQDLHVHRIMYDHPEFLSVFSSYLLYGAKQLKPQQ